MRSALLAAFFLASACSATVPQQADKRTLPNPLVAAKLPERPDAQPVPPAADWVIALSEGETVPEGQAGILMSQEKAARAAKYVVGYNELRQLYEVDLRTWGREREIYERHLALADAEVERMRQKAVRSFWERHAPEVAMVLGVVIGAAVTVSIVAAVHGTEDLAGATP